MEEPLHLQNLTRDEWNAAVEERRREWLDVSRLSPWHSTGNADADKRRIVDYVTHVTSGGPIKAPSAVQRAPRNQQQQFAQKQQSILKKKAPQSPKRVPTVPNTDVDDSSSVQPPPPPNAKVAEIDALYDIVDGYVVEEPNIIDKEDLEYALDHLGEVKTKLEQLRNVHEQYVDDILKLLNNTVAVFEEKLDLILAKESENQTSGDTDEDNGNPKSPEPERFVPPPPENDPKTVVNSWEWGNKNPPLATWEKLLQNTNNGGKVFADRDAFSRYLRDANAKKHGLKYARNQKNDLFRAKDKAKIDIMYDRYTYYHSNRASFA